MDADAFGFEDNSKKSQADGVSLPSIDLEDYLTPHTTYASYTSANAENTVPCGVAKEPIDEDRLPYAALNTSTKRDFRKPQDQSSQHNAAITKHSGQVNPAKNESDDNNITQYENTNSGYGYLSLINSQNTGGNCTNPFERSGKMSQENPFGYEELSLTGYNKIHSESSFGRACGQKTTVRGSTIKDTDDADSEYLTIPASATRPLPPLPRRKRDNRCRIMAIAIAVFSLIAVVIGLSVALAQKASKDGTRPTEDPLGWAAWNGWEDCSVSCGQGTQQRSRICQSNEAYRDCIGPEEQFKQCAIALCPVPPRGVWLSWSLWTDCSGTCGEGTQERERQCQIVSGVGCEGHRAQTRSCNEGNCPDCNYTCPGEGVMLHPDCDQCICKGNPTLTITITDHNNIRLDLVTISDKQWSGNPLEISDDGMATMTDVCIGTELVFSKAGHITTSQIVVALQTEYLIMLPEIENLYITKHPPYKRRLIGESVQLCCEVKGNLQPEYFEWYRDGLFIWQTGPGHSSSLTMDNLNQVVHAGTYTCKAYNRHSIVTSEAGRLDVQDDPANYCKTSLKSKNQTISLCQGGSPKVVDVGSCESLPCRRGESDNDKSSCSDSGGFCCGPVKTGVTIVPCDGIDILMPIVNECGCVPCPAEGIYLRGKVIDLNSQVPVAGATILVSDIEGGITSSDHLGDYVMILPNIGDNTYLKVSTMHSQYVSTFKSLSIDSTGQSYSEMFSMLKVADPITIDSSKVSSIPFTQISIDRQKYAESDLFTISGKFDFEGNSFLTLNGSEYDGNVDVSVTSLDSSDFNDMINAPAEMIYTNSDGDYQPLRAYTIFSLRFIDASTEEMLQLRHTINITLIVPYEITEDIWMFEYNDASRSWNDNAKLRKTEVGSLNTEISGPFFMQHGVQWLMVSSKINVRNICFSKIKVFETNKYNSLINRGSNIKVLVNNQPTNSVPNYGEISTFRAISDYQNGEGYCIAHSCGKQYNGYFTAALQDNTDSTFTLPDPKNFGIRENTATRIKYEANITEVPFIKATLEYSVIPVGQKGPYYEQHSYSWQRSDVCSLIPEDHFTFYHRDTPISGDTCTSESGLTIQEEIQDHPSGPEHLNNLAWFARSAKSLYDTCYIKILVSSFRPVTLRAFSKVGNISQNEDIVPGESLYGMREKCQDHAMCLEVKHPGRIHNGEIDNTLIQVQHLKTSDVSCVVEKIREELIIAYGQNIVTHEGSSEFHMFLKNVPFGPTFGIYCVKSEANMEDAKNKAKAMCYRGDYDDSLNILPGETQDNWAVHFKCQ